MPTGRGISVRAEPPRKALIKVGYGCNENCTFCHTLDTRHIDGTASEVHGKIERAAALGHGMVVLSGGEPTIRPELLDWAAHVAALDMDLGLVTNGRMLAYPELVDRLLESRLRYVYLSLHGGTAEVHNRLIRADGFDESWAALGLLSGRGLELTVNTVVTRQNLEHLEAVVTAVLPFTDLTLKFSMVQPKGGGALAFDALTPRVTDVADRVAAAIRRGIQRVSTAGSGPRFAHDGIPLCLLPGLEDLYSDLRTHNYATMVEIGETDLFPIDDAAKIQPPPCESCALRGPCPGLYRGYHEAFGAGELRPVTDRPRGNSFNYVFESLVPATSSGSCPLLEGGVRPWDRGRHLFVRKEAGGPLARYYSATRDFADVEIAAVKHELGQVYLDASRKAAPDDFARDLVKLRRSDECLPCPERLACTGVFEPVWEDLFTRDDTRVREILVGLTGDVLDVGCGDGRYGETLASSVGRGDIRYLGVDPDGERIAGLQARWPWAELAVCAAEELEALAKGRRFDHALVLRSWNHLRDTRAALGAIVRLVRPGGTVLLVDNVAFGLARTRARTAEAESSAALLEHLRNDGSAVAAAVASALGLVLLERRDVGQETANQWLLRYRCPESGRSGKIEPSTSV